MTKLFRFMLPLLFAGLFSGSVWADNDVQTSMRAMGKSLAAAEKADTAAGMQKELSVLRETIVAAQKQVPEKLKDQPADNPKRAVYTEGMGKLLTETDRALALLKENKLDEAKAVLATIKSLRGEYHQKMKS